MNLIAEIKSRIDCITLFRKLWPNNYREGGKNNSLCPFHGDSNGSLLVEADHIHCFGCEKHLDVIGIYQEHRGKSGITGKEMGQFLREIARELDIPLPEHATTSAKTSKTDKKKSPPSLDYLIKRWTQFSATPLSESARNYLEKERAIPGTVLDELAQKKFIGFSPQSDKYGETIEFPVLDWPEKTLLSIQHVPVGGGEKKFVELTKPKDGFFKHGNGGDFSVISEAVIDSLSIYTACKDQIFLDAISILSAGSYAKIKLIPVSVPIFFMDDDPGGIMATILALHLLGPGRAKHVDWSIAGNEGKDANDLLKKGKRDLILKMVKGAVGTKDEDDLHQCFKGLIARCREKIDAKKYNKEEGREKDHVRLSRIEAEVKTPYKEMAKKDPVAVATLSFEEHMAELNKMHAVIMLGGKCCILHEYTDPISRREDIDFWSVNDFHYKHAPRQVWIPNGSEGSRQIAATKLWIKSNQRREYDGLIFAPGTQTERYYNLFRGFAVTPIQGRWALFKRHIDQVIAGGDAAISKYILAWMAHLLQQPGGERPGTAIVLRGKQGTGKGFFVSQLGKILGHHFLHITQASHLTGKFNSHLKSALLVFVDEALWAGDKQGESVLKGIVTEDTIMVEHKGKDTVRMKNHVSIIVASNNEWVVPAGPEERRFLVLDVKETHMQDREYFQALFDEMNNGGREAMLYDLLNMGGLDKVDLRTIPRTDAQLDQICYSMTGIQKFWMEVLMRGTLLAEHHEWEGVVQTAKLYGEYAEFCKTINDRYPLAGNMFTKQLKKMTPEGSTKRAKKTFHHKEGERYSSKVEWCLWFADLKKCRESFDKLIHKSIMWGDEAETETMEKELTQRKIDAEKEEKAKKQQKQ